MGMVFLPQDPAQYEAAKAAVHKVAANQGHSVLGWRRVPTDNRCRPPARPLPALLAPLPSLCPHRAARHPSKALPAASPAAVHCCSWHIEKRMSCHCRPGCAPPTPTPTPRLQHAGRQRRED